MKDKIKDPKYPETEWKKKSHTHEHLDGTGTETEIHYWENKLTGERHGFKFKDDNHKSRLNN